MELRDQVSTGVGSFFAAAGAILAGLAVMAAISAVVFYFSLVAIASWAEQQSPGSFEGPMTAAGPIAAAAVVTVLFQIVLVGILAAFRVPFAKVFLVLLVVFYASVGAAGYLSFWSAIRFEGRYPAGFFSVQTQFPVLVITPDPQTGRHHADVVEWSQLASFGATHPNHSFVVPEGEKEELNAQLPRHDFVWASQTGAPYDALVWAHFEVEDLGAGRQEIVVQGSWMRNENASMRSWYEADAGQVHPKYFEDGDTYGLYFRNAALLVGAIDLAGLAFYLWRRRRKPRTPRAALTPAAAD